MDDGFGEPFYDGQGDLHNIPTDELLPLSSESYEPTFGSQLMTESQEELMPVPFHSDTLDDILCIARPECISHLTKYPTLNELDTDFKFEVTLNSETSGKSSWMYSGKMKKVFIKMGQTFNVDISYMSFQQSLMLRVMIVYTNELHTPVVRCNNHRVQGEKEDPVKIIPHILRCLSAGVRYEGLEKSANFGDRLSCCIPLQRSSSELVEREPIPLNFVCQNSCSSGMNRRPTSIIFTLEKMNNEIVGKKIMHFKVCSCPKRDKDKEEQSFESQNMKRKGGSDVHNSKRPCKVQPVVIKTEPMVSPDQGIPSSPDYNTFMQPEGVEVTLTMPDLDSMQHVLRCALNEITAKMENCANPEQYMRYKEDIKRNLESIKRE